MKANAPEKIYRRSEGKYVKYYDYKPAKISYNEKEPTEYTSTDAFIEKAENYLKNQFIKDISVLAGGVVSISFDTAISNFKNYMKGK